MDKSGCVGVLRGGGVVLAALGALAGGCASRDSNGLQATVGTDPMVSSADSQPQRLLASPWEVASITSHAWSWSRTLASVEHERYDDERDTDDDHEEEEAGPKRIPGWQPQEPWPASTDDQGPDFGFEAIPGTGWVPADAGLAVGHNHMVAIVNGQLAFFDKQGNNTFRRPLAGASGFWVELGAAGLVFDPEAHYDPYHDRFWVMACERTGFAGYFNVAVSDDGDPNGVWRKYRIDVTEAAGGPDIDSPNLSINGNAIYLSADFEEGTKRTFVHIVPKGSMLTGNPITGARSMTIPLATGLGLPARWDGTSAAQFLLHAPSSSAGSTTLTLYAVRNPLTTPVLATVTLSVPQYLPPGRPEQPGTTVTADIFGPRFWSCVHRNGSLWATHHVTDPATGRTVSRWYEFTTGSWPTSGTPTLRQWGQIDGGSDVYTFCPSIGVDDENNAAITCVQSGPSTFITIGRALRRATDPLNTFRATQAVRASTASFTVMERWGDYSSTVPDPDSPCTFWGHHQWTTSPGDWRTWVARYENRPLADFDASCDLNVNDFMAFLNAANSLDPRADLDHDNQITVLDFMAFMNAFQSGA